MRHATHVDLYQFSSPFSKMVPVWPILEKSEQVAYAVNWTVIFGS